ncbi:pentatricopeptide (PPR) repeat protein [Medicago truncatula]|uniref:Pentatricopeptide (PPR) repeat protein n=1 Tax=Medicago truncatula TaxID=3880 RepID=G7IDB1_MEDTR|nr:pentatricopeptide (PPR) repeat protein [Medicago truncatula]
MEEKEGRNIRAERMTLRFQQCPLPPPQLQTQLRLKKNNTIRCTLTKQGQRFLTKLSTTNTNTENLIRKFVQSSPKSVLLSTLTHLLSPTTAHHPLSSLALPLYTRISESQWYTWNPTIFADLITLLHKHQRYTESQTLISEATSKLNNKERDIVLFYAKLLDSHSKRASQTGFDFAYSHLNNLLRTSSSIYVKRRASESMVSGLCAMDKPREAENLVQEFKRTDGGGKIQLQPSAFEFKSILVVDEMENNGFVIDTVCYNMVLSSFGIHGEYVEMVSWLTRMRNSGVPFSVRTYNSVSNSCPTVMRKVVDLNDLAFSIEELLNSCLEGGEAMVVKELLSCNVLFDEVMVWDSKEVKLDLHGFHLGSAYLVMLLWLEEMQKRLLNASNHDIPAEITVVCGVGKHSNVRGESPVKVLVKEMMMKMKGPLRIDRKNTGCFVAKGKAVKIWLCELRKQ